MSNHFPTYLSLNPSGYYVFRIRIPRDIINALDGKTEIRRSLRTRSRSKALRCGIKLARLMQSLFAQIRANGDNFMTELSKADINNMLDKWFKQALAEDEEHRVTREPFSELEHSALSLEYSDLKQQMSADLAYSEYSRVARYVDQMLEEQGVNGNLDSVSYKRLCREMLKKYVELLDIIQRREEGDYRSPLASPAGTPTAGPEDPGTPLSKVIDHYLDENKKRLNAKTFQEA